VTSSISKNFNMPDDKYTQEFMASSLDLLQRLFAPDPKYNEFYVSSKTLRELFGRIDGHLASAFPEGNELLVLRRLRGKLEPFRQNVSNSLRNETGAVLDPEDGHSLLQKFCESPDF